jgi:hypothetical protein
MEFREDIALLHARLCELLATGESQSLWDNVQQAVANLKSAFADQSPTAIRSAMGELDDLVKRGVTDSMRWQEVYGLTEQVGKTKEREHKRLVAMQQMISSEQLLAVLGQIALAAKQTISNSHDLQQFSKALSQYGILDTRVPDRGQ